MASIYQEMARLEKQDQAAVLCTVIQTSGSTPRHSTSKMLVYPDGRITGTIGGGELENQVIIEANKIFTSRVGSLFEYQMKDPSKGDVGICGGKVTVFIEPIFPAPLVIVIGCGHVGKAVAHLAKWLGFRVAASDDRPDFCTIESIPEADLFFPVEMRRLPDHATIDANTYLVLTTRGGSVDIEGLPTLIKTQAAYIGVIGSKRRMAETLKHLAKEGFSRKELLKIHSPIGIEIDAETPEEIAVSILAEIIHFQRSSLLEQEKQ
jgi:xanthine dehydrogenase accessory factor